ncbi:MAG: InlB B-repeat-containing protein, partial [Oscillibacter sp.]|nr:InlB B-repeat-containing protein [Oscillibacter sp.]
RFNGNGGTPESTSVNVISGGIATAPATNPTRDGYEFTGWYTDPQAGTVFDFTTPIRALITLYAGWRLVLPPDVLSQGTCGANLTYVLRTDGTLTISGTGSMSDYSAAAPAPWYAYRQSIRAAVLESGVGSVGAYAFGDCSALSALTLPNSVGTVAPHAFDGCAVLETVSYDGTQEQWDAVIFSTAYNDALEFATVRCGDETYNAYRTLGFFGTDGRMEAASEQTWRFPVPLARFRNLFIDVEDAENAPDGTELVRKASTGELSHAEGSREYAATSGSTILTIPQETFETFQEGSHSITATFQDSRQATRTTSNVYTIFPTGPIDINEAELTARAVEDVSYTGRLQTTPKLSDKFYRFNITAATRDGETLTITRRSGEDTENETANDVQQIDAQAFYFHPNGRFSGIPTTPGTYELTVELQVRREINDDWYTPEGEQDNPRVVTIVVEEKNANNIAFTSEGYEVVQEPPATIEQGTPFQMAVTKDPEDRLTAVYLDSELLVENQDYTISTQIIQAPRLLDGGILTQLAINVTKTNIGVGLHSLNLEFEHVDSLGNTQTKNVARPLTVTARRAVTPVNTISSGSSGGSSRSTTPTVTTYTVKVSKPSHGTLTLSATKVAAGKSVTITATPNSGYQTASVSVVDSQKKAVQTSRDGNKYTFTMPKRSVTVSASFTLSTYSLTASQAQHGQVSLNRSTAAPGATINGTTTPDKGYLLSSVAVRDANGRSVNVETFNDGKFTFLMPSGRVTVSATFTVKRLASFVDIQGPDWFFDDAEWAYNKSILRGMNETYWEPQSLMSSVTSIVTLERLDGVDLTPYDTGADDGIDNSAWYASAQRWARDNHILLQDRPFGERDPMTRGECAVMLTNYLRYRGLNVTPKSESTFTDADQLTPDELNAFRLLQDADVFRGYGDGTIRPKAYLSRAHLSALLHRLSTYIIREETGGI